MPSPDPLGIMYPTGFDTETYAQVNESLAVYANAQAAQTWRVFAAAWNGIAYRLRGAQDNCNHLVKSLATSSSQEERYAQEAALFGFYSSAASALECLYLAAYCAASLRRPALVPISRPGHLNKYAEDVVELFKRKFPNDHVVTALSDPMDSTWWSSLFDFRNALMHRGSLPRMHFLTTVPSMNRPSAVPSNPKALSDTWSYDFDLVPATFERLYSTVLATINVLMVELQAFLQRHQ